MEIVYGSVEGTAPEGFLARRVHFGTLTRLNEPTKEGMLSRTILGSGFGTRELPLAIGYLSQTAHSDMHLAPIVGRLDAVKIDGNNVEGWGWIADTPDGRLAFQALNLGVLKGNSVDLCEVKYSVDIDWDDETDDLSIKVMFTESKVGATTLCPIPAFGSAGAKLEELTAALEIEGDLEVDTEFTVRWDNAPANLTAAGGVRGALPPAAFVDEPDEPTPWTISDDGKFAFGHLGTWDACHTAWTDRCVRIPHSRTNYGNYCSNRFPLEGGGHVWTGPVLLLEGHRATREAINKASESIENVYANVTVVDGKFGPWACGVIVPGITDEALHAARSGQVSGHWLNGELHAVASVPVPGFNTPRATSFQVELDDEGEVESLVASIAIGCGCDDEPTLEERVKNLEHVVGIHTEAIEASEESSLNAAVRAAAMLSVGDDDGDDA